MKPYDLEGEVAHAETLPWGKEDTGTALNDFKGRMYRSVLRLLVRHSPPPGMLLDVGCSFGGFLVQARRIGYDVVGMDIVPRAVAYVNSLGIAAKVGSSLREGGGSGRANPDIITCLDCNCYWPDQPAEIRHAYDMLRPGGLLAMRVVDKSWLFSLGLMLRRLDARAAERVLRTSVNDHRFSMPVRAFLGLVRRVGFRVVYASPAGAVHSDKSRWPVKAAFAIGRISRSVGGPFIAPGALVILRKPTR
jgi:SAM-dependent methyltransferase